LSVSPASSASFDFFDAILLFPLSAESLFVVVNDVCLVAVFGKM
jgi:hypothetical protein